MFVEKSKVLFTTSDSQTVTFCDFLSNFRKNTAKNTTKPGNSHGLLHFFDIFFVTVRESLLYNIYIFQIKKQVTLAARRRW